MTAVPLFDVEQVGKARKRDPDTSKSAARDTAAKLAGRRARIVKALERGPACDDCLCVRLGEEVRWWPSVKTARSGLTTQPDPLVEYAGRSHDGQRVWRLVAGTVVDVATRGGVL